MARDKDQPLFPASLFEYENRPARDVAFAYIYLFSLLATLVGGIVAFSNRNGDYDKLTSTAKLNDPSSCPATAGRRLLQERAQPEEFNFSEFMVMAGIWIAVSFVGATILGIMFLHLLKKHARAMITATVAIQIAIPLIAGIATAASGALVPGIILMALAALTAVVFYMWRDQIPLVAKLMSVSATGLQDNPSLIWIVILLQVSLVVINVPILFSMFVSYMNGDLVYNTDRASPTECVDVAGQAVPCCLWQPDAWVFPYIAFAALTMSWTVFLSFEIKVFTTAGTVAQWYFAPVSVHSFRGNSLRSLKHAFGPSFGSLCLGSGVLTLCDLLRHATENARQENRDSILLCLLACITDCITSILEFVTKFATIRTAISGEAFFTAGKNVVELLKRHLLSAVGVWWLPPTVLNTCAFTLSLTWALFIGATSYATWSDRGQAAASAAILGVISFLFSLVVLAFFISLILNVLDAVFICYALDRDQHTFTKPAVHEMFAQVPTIGPIVENPDGGVTYGAPAAEGGAYRPPSPQALSAPGSRHAAADLPTRV